MKYTPIYSLFIHISTIYRGTAEERRVIIDKWNYVSKVKRSDGYEDVIDYLNTFKYKTFVSSSEEVKSKMIDNVFEVYRQKNIFPIFYYNDEGISEEINKCIQKEVSIKDNYLNITSYQGASLCRFMFPNLSKTKVEPNIEYSLYDRFYDDNMLKRAINFTLKYTRPRPTNLRDGLRMSWGSTALNFDPMRAKAIYEKYVPANGKIYDYSSGFGGRLLGALTSKNNYCYYGVEPNLETFIYLNELGNHIEKTRNTKNSFKIFNTISEDYCENEYFDFAFSSPPYFNLERYSDEETQCYNKFPEIESWINGYVKPTIQNIYKSLKNNSYYAVNIADFKLKGKEIKFVEKWIDLSLDAGFSQIEKIDMKLHRRRGVKSKANDDYKHEGIYIFKK